MGGGKESIGVEAVKETGSAKASEPIDWRLRAAIAFAIAPVSIGLLALPFPLGMWALTLSATVGYPIAIVVGVPLFVLSRAFGWMGIRSYALFAAAFSLILITAFILMPALSQGDSLPEIFLSGPRWGQMILAPIVAGLSCAVFWVIARPDKE